MDFVTSWTLRVDSTRSAGSGQAGSPQVDSTGSPQVDSTHPARSAGSGQAGSPQVGSTGSPQVGSTGSPQVDCWGYPLTAHLLPLPSSGVTDTQNSFTSHSQASGNERLRTCMTRLMTSPPLPQAKGGGRRATDRGNGDRSGLCRRESCPGVTQPRKPAGHVTVES